GIVDSEEQRHEVETKFVGGLEVTGEGRVRGALMLLYFRIAQKTAVTRRTERLVGCREGGEGIGFVMQPERSDAHGTSGCWLTPIGGQDIEFNSVFTTCRQSATARV